MVTCDVNGISGFEALLKHPRVQQAGAVADQEHHLEQTKLASWESKLFQIGWKAAMAAATPTGRGGTSGGILQMAPSAESASRHAASRAEPDLFETVSPGLRKAVHAAVPQQRGGGSLAPI